MAAGTALKKINARAKALKKKHPGKKYRTLQKQAGAEYKAGKLKAKRKPAKRKTVKRKAVAKRKPAARKTRKRVARKVGKPTTVVYSLGKLIKRKRRKRAAVKSKGKRRVSGSGNSSLMPILLLGGLGLAAYLLLKPAAVPALYQSSNQLRNTSSNNILQYATAAGLGISAITALINSLNNMSDNDVINASNNPASAVAQLSAPTSTVVAPTGGPSIYM